MRVRWSLLIGALLAALTVSGLGPTPAAKAETGCGPSDRLPVTVLIRPGAGSPFQALDSDTAEPYVDVANSRTMVPLRFLVQALSPGANAVSWNAATRGATFHYGTQTLQVHLAAGSTSTKWVTVNGESVAMQVFACGGHLYAPARAVADAFGLPVEYHGARIVTVDGAAGSALEQPSAASGTAASLTGTVTGPALAARCVGSPHTWADYLSAPVATMREAARVAACQIKSY